jgi:hypothetical protein
MIEITVNDRLGKKVRVKCNEDDTIGDLKKLVAAQTGTRSVSSSIKLCSSQFTSKFNMVHIKLFAIENFG